MLLRIYPCQISLLHQYTCVHLYIVFINMLLSTFTLKKKKERMFLLININDFLSISMMNLWCLVNGIWIKNKELKK